MRRKIQPQRSKKVNLELAVRDAKGKKIDTVILNEDVFDGQVNMPLMHQAVTMYRANKRLGNASCKTRAEVSGGGKKPWRQKGTGRARTGSIRNPLWRGGGVIFGPHPRDFSYTLPQKIRRRALKSGINSKLLADDLIVIDELKIQKPKTKEFRAFLKMLGIKENEGVLVVLEKPDKDIYLASRNIPKLCIKTTGNFNLLDILEHKKLIMQRSSLLALTKGLSQ